MERLASYLALIALIALGTGCAHRAALPPAQPVIQATPVVITPREDEAPEATFRRAELLLLEGKGAEAAPLFDRLMARTPCRSSHQDVTEGLLQCKADSLAERTSQRRAKDAFICSLHRLDLLICRYQFRDKADRPDIAAGISLKDAHNDSTMRTAGHAGSLWSWGSCPSFAPVRMRYGGQASVANDRRAKEDRPPRHQVPEKERLIQVPCSDPAKIFLVSSCLCVDPVPG